ncbi:MAG: hypothetical protein AAGF95_22120 [Chloroflexota bacterium]
MLIITAWCIFEAALNWITVQFPSAHNSNRFVLSPLVGGTNNLMPFSNADGTFTQIVMYVSTFKRPGETATEVSVSDRAAYCRTTFTEIVHGYVNPATYLYFEEVEQAMPDITSWNTDAIAQTAYSTNLVTFNEYMTWAMCSLYIMDTFPPEAQEEAIQYQEDILVDRRGFVQYREFNGELMRLYKEREPEQTITNLYPAILDWVTEQATS